LRQQNHLCLTKSNKFGASRHKHKAIQKNENPLQDFNLIEVLTLDITAFKSRLL